VVTQANDQQSILNTVQQEMAQRRKQKAANGNAVVVMKNGTNNVNNGIGNSPVALMTRQDSRLSVKSLIESIENTAKQQSGSNTSLNTLTDQPQPEQGEKIKTEEKQQKALSNNNNNNNIISTTNSVVNGTPKSGGKSYA
jgi:hypothetical protein